VNCGWHTARSRFLDLAVAGAVLLQLAGVYLPPIRALLGTDPLGLAELAVAALAATLPGFVIIARRLRKRPA
jgi:P-type Ca2+ transporter type 2C